MGPGSLSYTVEDALWVGTDAAVVSAFPGFAKEEETFRAQAKVVGEAPRLGRACDGHDDSLWL